MGFPGELPATCVYRFIEPATLRVELTAVCRQGDARQSDPARLFQSRRLARHSRSRAGAGLRLLHADRRRADPDRRNSRRRRHGLRFPHEPAGAQHEGVDLRHQFRRVARAGPGRSGACRAAALAEEPADAGIALAPSRACSSTTPPSSIAPCRGSTARITARTPVSAWSRRRFRIRPTAAISPTPCCARIEEYRHVSEFRFS